MLEKYLGLRTGRFQSHGHTMMVLLRRQVSGWFEGCLLFINKASDYYVPNNKIIGEELKLEEGGKRREGKQSLPPPAALD